MQHDTLFVHGEIEPIRQLLTNCCTWILMTCSWSTLPVTGAHLRETRDDKRGKTRLV